MIQVFRFQIFLRVILDLNLQLTAHKFHVILVSAATKPLLPSFDLVKFSYPFYLFKEGLSHTLQIQP